MAGHKLRWKVQNMASGSEEVITKEGGIGYV